MAKLTVKDLLEAKGKPRLAYVQVAREEEAAAAAEAGMDMIGTGFRPKTSGFPKARNVVVMTEDDFGAVLKAIDGPG